MKVKTRILLTRPTNLYYERFVFTFYLNILRFVQDQLNRVATLEEDLELLERGEPGNSKEPIDFEFRMAVVYRAEKKKILRSQINLIQKIIQKHLKFLSVLQMMGIPIHKI